MVHYLKVLGRLREFRNANPYDIQPVHYDLLDRT